MKTIYSQNGMTCSLTSSNHYLMTGGGFGKHVLSADETSDERLLAHWSGYLENNGHTLAEPEKLIKKTETMYLNGELYCCVETDGEHRSMLNVSDDSDLIVDTEENILKMPTEKQPSPNADGFMYDTMQEMHAAISKEYQRALRVVKKDFPVTVSSPCILMMKDGDRHYDPIYYSGSITKKFLQSIIEEYPEAEEISYDNGIDGAESLVAYHEWSDYQPSVEFAELTLWKKV